ncbi:unnamed protein product [Cochlearia groenlandica]
MPEVSSFRGFRLTPVHGDEDAALTEVLKNLDPNCQEISGNIVHLEAGNLVVQLRNYTLPLIFATSAKCEGRIVTFPVAQQVTYFQPQISQDVSVGRWRKVQMFRPATCTTPLMKTYSDMRIYFEQGEVSFGVGYEPAFADISNAFTVALSHRNPNVVEIVKEEQILPWWDHMRNYVFGSITMCFSESKWDVLASTYPYDSQDKLQIVTGPIKLQCQHS